MFVHKEVIRKQNNIDNNLLPQFAALSERQRHRFYPPKMVQLCLQILYARTANYKILKPQSLINQPKNALIIPNFNNGDI